MTNPISKLTTPQLILREYRLDDAEELIDILGPNIDHMLPWIPWARDEPESLENKRDRIRMWNNNHQENKDFYTYGIFKKNDRKMIGTVYLFTRRGPGILEIGYWIDKDQTGRGFATECTYAMTKLGFEHIQIDKMEIHCDSHNTASSRVPEKLKYTNEFDYRILERNEEGDRRVFKAWVLFKDEYETIPKYEPMVFFDRKGIIPDS
jgi:RimJ/RimL family protein N-acetyltransferase